MLFRGFIITIYLTATVTAIAQCPNDFFTKTFSSSTSIHVTKSVSNNQQEIGVAGGTDGVFTFQGTGMIAKFTEQGTALWMKSYSIPGFRYLNLMDIAAHDDGGFIAVGYFYDGIDSITQMIKKGWGIVLRVDKFGNTKWARALSNYSEVDFITQFQSIDRTSGGDYVLFGHLFRKPQQNILARAPQLILRIDDSGEVIWRTTFQIDVDNTPLGPPALLELSNGDLELAFNMFQQQKTAPGTILKEGYALMRLNGQSGTVEAKRYYTYHTIPSLIPASLSPVVLIHQFQNGDLAYHFAFSDTSYMLNSPNTKRCAIMKTGASGNIQRVNGYYNGIYGCAVNDGFTESNRNRTLLINDGRTNVIAKIDENENFLWDYSYPSSGNRSAALQKISSGYNIYSGTFGELLVTKTDNDGEACEKEDMAFTKEDITWMFSPWDLSINTLQGDEFLQHQNTFVKPLPVSEQVLCSDVCCTDLIGPTVIEGEICEGKTFQLPTNEQVTDSGMYYVRYLAQSGCDSIQYYHLKLIKNPADLSISGDQCLETSDTIRLAATAGFENYNWMGINSTDSIRFVTTPGTYWVRVENNCGVKTDSILVYDKCEFDIFMPTAFTPNGDKLNDDFGVPHQNKNKLIKLAIYNRWGNKVFETNDKLKRWDGTVNGKYQPQDAYVYFLIMETLSGQVITKKGTVALIR